MKNPQVVVNITTMLALHKQHHPKLLEKNRIQCEIASMYRAIDNVVYELYGLSEEEVRIVEGE